MKVATVIFALVVVCAYANNEYDFNIFEREIDEKCLNRWWTKENSPNDMKPIGLSLESFLAMVEKVEGNHTDWDIFRVTKELLKRFAFEEIIFKDLSGRRRPVQEPKYKNRWDILLKLLPDDQIEEAFKEDDLSEEEKCTMFFMMGHLVNDTYRSQELDGESYFQDVPLEAPFPAESPIQRTKQTKRPREQGVISIDGSSTQAIAISKVLNAIIAGQSEAEHSIGNIITDVQNKAFPKEMKIKPVIAVTIGDVVSLATIYHDAGSSGVKFFGPGGTWNHSSCPTEFILNANATGSTNALLRGAVDGLLISQALKTWGGNIRGLKLSRVLRTYYSPKGLPMAHGMKDGVSYCRRQELTTHIGQSIIQESVLAYYYMQFWKEHAHVEKESAEKVSEAINHMNNALGSMDHDFGTDECRLNAPSDRPTCETPSNVFIVLDSSEAKSQGFKQQQEIIGKLASKVDFGYGSLTVLIDKLKGSELESVAFNDSNPTCAGCRTAWIEENRLGSQSLNEIALLDGLNKTLKEFERETDLLPGVPNKVAVIFRYKELTENQDKIKNAANILKNGHRDTRVLVVGENRDKLSVMTRDIEDVVTEGDIDRAAEALQKKICKVPAVFQFNRCWDHKRTTRKEDQNNYVGYVTENHVQFWAFHPEYFLKSYNIVVKFIVEASGGDITVCEQRGFDNPGFTRDGVLDEKNCQKSDSSNRELVFKINNPCEGYDVNNCPTMNFAIIGRVSSSTANYIGCTEEHDTRCRRLDQIKFKVVHEGISCNGCEFLKSSSVLLGFLALLFVFKNAV